MKTILTRQERLGLLLHLMGDEAVEMARDGLEGQILADLDQALNDFREFPPSDEEIDLVLGDFEDYFRMVMEAKGPNGRGQSDEEEVREAPRILQIAEESFDVELEPTKRFERPALSGDSVQDLNQVHPYQVAQAIKSENAIAASLVIRKLANEHAAKTMEFLPDAIRAKVFLELAKPTTVTPLIQERVFKTTLQRALEVEEREAESETTDQMADLMRSLPRGLRKPMLDELEKRDSDLADAVRNKLYRFEDIEKMSDRDLQKLLGHCQTETLVCALQKVEESFLTFVLSNMSKRAKESLQEEMEFKANAEQEEIDEARSAMARSLASLCESGEVKLD